MNFYTSWKIRKLQRKLAGLNAKLTATRELFNLCSEEVPGIIIINMQELPQEIAEIEKQIEQLTNK